MSQPPTLYEWLGGMPALEQLTSLFYSRVADDPILAPVFANMSADHPRHVAEFLGEVFGRPRDV
jgi:hemoglobin